MGSTVNAISVETVWLPTKKITPAPVNLNIREILTLVAPRSGDFYLES